jgi:hypothetical protein
MDLLAVERAGVICCPYLQVAVQFNHIMLDSAVRWTLERRLDGRPYCGPKIISTTSVMATGPPAAHAV